jgi:hypothetical protein
LLVPCEELPTAFKIVGLRIRLRQIIEPHDDFLSLLLSKGILTYEQYEGVCSKTTVCDKNEQLLSYVLDRNYTGDHDEVLQALKESDQQHVANFISSGGGTYLSLIVNAD